MNLKESEEGRFALSQASPLSAQSLFLSENAPLHAHAARFPKFGEQNFSPIVCKFSTNQKRGLQKSEPGIFQLAHC